MWLFGYGSLIWKIDFPIQRKVIGCIKGYVRRFYQSSPEHRGDPIKPGRVVTLLPSSNPDDIVWGVAYEISDEQCPNVLEHLDYREKSGYSKKSVTFHPRERDSTLPSPFNLTVYIASPQNEWFVEESDIREIAQHIAQCKGMSGTNVEYLFKLADSVRTIAPEAKDPHLFELEAEVKRLIREKPESNHR